MCTSARRKGQLSGWYHTKYTIMQPSLGWVYLISPWICTIVRVSSRRRYAAVGPRYGKKKNRKMMVVCMGRRMQWRGQGWSEKMRPGTAQKETTARSWWQSQPWPSYTPKRGRAALPLTGSPGSTFIHETAKRWKKRETDRKHVLRDSHALWLMCISSNVGCDEQATRHECNKIFERGILAA